MFDFAWSEIALIGVVALVAIGPKDMPVAIRAVARAVKKARRMAAEFQTHVDDMIRDTELHEVRKQFNDIRHMDLNDQIIRTADPDGAVRRTLRDDPFKAAEHAIHPPAEDAAAEAPEPMTETPAALPAPHPGEQAVDLRPAHEMPRPPDADPAPRQH